MRTPFNTFEIKRIEFEEGETRAQIVCLTETNSNRETVLWVNFSDLNRIVSKLQGQNEIFDFDELFTVYCNEKNQNLYEANETKLKKLDCSLKNFDFHYSFEQIRA